MVGPEQLCDWIFRNKTSTVLCALAIPLLLILAVVSAQAQTYTVLHAFSGPDGNAPFAGLIADRAGNLYGTTSAGGSGGCSQGQGCGTVFRLSRAGSGWVLTSLYEFKGEDDGWEPMARVMFGPDGSLYGTTEYGGIQPGIQDGYGTVFKLTPPPNICGSISCPWVHTVLYRFRGGSDGGVPGPGDLTFDSAGNIYGTTELGGIANPNCFWQQQGCGVIFELAKSGHDWTESVLYSFTGGNDGDTPNAGVIFDSQGNLYGTTDGGGQYLYGTVFQLTPSGSGWTESVIHAFTSLDDGAYPEGLTFDGSGNLYGIATGSLLFNSGGAAYEMMPSGGGWDFNVLSQFPAYTSPWATPTLHNGNLYGPTLTGGTYGAGSIFQLSPGGSNWTLTTLYNFMGPNDGNGPYGSVLVDTAGNVYGTASGGGQYSEGVVFEITP
jgi:uncharacterized repeat protein (TIGR03803 family)